MRPVLALALLAGVSGCAALPAATIVADLATGTTALQDAVSLYGVAKGMALAAAPADQTLPPKIAQADVVVAKAQTAMADVNTDAATLVSLAAQVQSQAGALTAAAAPKITVTANGQ